MMTPIVIAMSILTLATATELLIQTHHNLSVDARVHAKSHHNKSTELLSAAPTITISVPSTTRTSSISPVDITTTFSLPSTTSTTSTTESASIPPSTEPETSSAASTTAPEASSTPLTTDSETSTILTTSTLLQARITPDPISGLQKCYVTACLQSFNRITTCYSDSSPWTDPYNSTQIQWFRDCVCGINASNPFTPSSPFYANFANCLNCIFLAYTFDVTKLTAEELRVESFCLAQEPDAYLFVKDLALFFGNLDLEHTIGDAAPGITAPPLPSVTPLVTQLAALYSTTPPLANLAYGPSAPAGGSLVGVTPSLTTWTSGTDTVTSLVTWVPTAGGGTYDAGKASRSAKSQASAALGTSFGAETSLCYGRGPCRSGGRTLRPSGMAGGVCILFMVSIVGMA